MDGRHTQAPLRGRLTHANVDAITAVIIVLLGLVMMVDSYRSGAGWAADGPQTGYFPFYIGAIMCIAALIVFLKALFGNDRNREIFVPWQRFRLVMLVFIPTVVYVLAIEFLGIYVASAIFIAGFMRAMDKAAWWKVAAIGVGTNVALFWMFEIWFLVPLPKGPLEALLGY